MFESALEHPPEERDHHLRAACGGDEALRAEVEAMLARHDRSGRFLEDPALDAEARALARDLASHGTGAVAAAGRAAARDTTTAATLESRAPWWMWLLAGVFLADCLLRIVCHLWGPESFGFELRRDPQAQVVAAVRPGSPAALAGIEPGDVLLSFDGQPFQERSDWSAVSPNLQVGGTYRFEVLRGDHPLSVPVTVGRVGLMDNPVQRQHALWQFNSLLLLVTAMFIAFRRPHDPGARLGALALATLSVGLYFTLLPRGYAAQWRALPTAVGLLLWVPNLCVYLVGPIVFSFFATFPRPVFRRRWVLPLTWLPALALAPIFARSYYLTVYEPHQAFGHVVSGQVLAAGVALFGLYGMASVTALAVNYLRLPSLTERRRLRVLLLGGALATLPSLVRFLLWPMPESSLTRMLSTPAADYALALLFALFPLSVAYSILRHRLFDIRVMLRQGLQYALARGVLLSLVPLLGLALLLDLLVHGDEPLLAIVQARGWVYATLGVAALVAHALRKRWGEALDRRFFREQYDARRVLLDLAARASGDHDFADAASRVVGRIGDTLHPEHVAILRRPRNDVVFMPETVAPPGAEVPPLLAEGPLVARLRRDAAPLRVAAGDADRRSLSLTAHDRSFLHVSRSELLVPIAMTPPGDEALLLLGPKRSEQPYTREDAGLLAAIAAHLAVLLVRPAPAAAGHTGDFRECPQCGACQDTGTDRCPDDGATLEAAHLPRVLASRYRLERRLGLGGMGAVYEAIDQTLGRTVAIKILREDRLDDEEVARRFRREARAAASLSGPHVVTVHDYGVEAGRRAFLVMERLHGRTLREEIQQRGPLGARRTLQVFRGICAAVQEAHRHQLVHRDLKPDNVFLARTDADTEVVKVLDFGIAKFLAGGGARDARAMQETSAGLLVGTPNYLSPEQLLGQPSAVESDLWALAVTAYECLAGTLPFPTGDRDRWRSAVLTARYVPIEDHVPGAPPGWRDFFARCFALDQERRPRTAGQFLEALEQALA